MLYEQSHVREKVLCEIFEYRIALINIQQSLRLSASLSPNSDQHQISPCNINAYSTPEVMRIKVMIPEVNFNFINNILFCQEINVSIKHFLKGEIVRLTLYKTISPIFGL